MQSEESTMAETAAPEASPAPAIQIAPGKLNPQCRLQSRGLESLTAGLQSLWLASRLKPWLRTIDGLGRVADGS